MTMRFCSDDIENGQHSLVWDRYRISCFFEPFEDQHGGDRFAFELSADGTLFFYIADAAGHGAIGAKFWQSHREKFDLLWRKFVAAPVGCQSLKEFAVPLNSHLQENSSDALSSQLCLVIGCITRDRKLHFGNFGYGAHILVTTAGGPWWTSTDKLFGLKLGWIDEQSWEVIPRAFVANEISSVTRITLLTDSFLGDDYADPQKTLQFLQQLGKTCADIPAADIIPYFLENLPHDQDDTSLVMIDF